mgnify:FL=1
MTNPRPFLDIIAARHCQRAFLPDEVPRETIDNILATAANAPSGKNTQPWQVEIVTGEALQSLSSRLCKLFDAETPLSPDYAYDPDPKPPEFIARARACGHAIFSHKNIGRHDHAGRRAHVRRNFVFFDAPLLGIFHLPQGAARGNFLDLGMFMQNVMLGLVAHGLGSCPQASIAGYPGAIRECLGLDDSRVIVAGLAIGVPDQADPVNTFIPERLPLEEFVQWHATRHTA